MADLSAAGEKANEPVDVRVQLLRVLRGALRGTAIGATLYVGADVVSGVANGKLLARSVRSCVVHFAHNACVLAHECHNRI